MQRMKTSHCFVKWRLQCLTYSALIASCAGRSGSWTAICSSRPDSAFWTLYFITCKQSEQWMIKCNDENRDTKKQGAGFVISHHHKFQVLSSVQIIYGQCKSSAWYKTLPGQSLPCIDILLGKIKPPWTSHASTGSTEKCMRLCAWIPQRSTQGQGEILFFF